MSGPVYKLKIGVKLPNGGQKASGTADLGAADGGAGNQGEEHIGRHFVLYCILTP